MKLPPIIAKVTATGNPKYDALVERVLNKNPEFRKAAERIARRRNREWLNELLYGKVKE